MKKISCILTGAIFSTHLALAYMIGLSIEPFMYHPNFIWMLIPVVIIIGIFFARLDFLFKGYKSSFLKKKTRATATNMWFWILLFLSSLLIVGIIYCSGQLLVPETEISKSFLIHSDIYQGVVGLLVLYTTLYFILLVWIQKTLENIWRY